jgi:hypothetical protein
MTCDLNSLEKVWFRKFRSLLIVLRDNLSKPASSFLCCSKLKAFQVAAFPYLSFGKSMSLFLEKFSINIRVPLRKALLKNHRKKPLPLNKYSGHGLNPRLSKTGLQCSRHSD